LDIDYIVSGVKSAGQDEDLVMIPMLDVSAGAGVGAVMSEASEYKVDGLCFSRAWIAKRNLNPDQLRVIDVRGKSMEGILADGDRVLVNLQDTKPRSGFVYVIRQGDELLVKYCQLLPGGMLRLSSENPQFQPYDIDLERTDDVAIIGRVVTSVHNW
jgi:phage repressor protein C with HTH and peptisase S24 domain